MSNEVLLPFVTATLVEDVWPLKFAVIDTPDEASSPCTTPRVETVASASLAEVQLACEVTSLVDESL